MPTLVGARRRGFTPGRLPAVRRAHRRVEVGLVDRHERARGRDARRPQRERAAAHRGARSGQARHRQLSGRARARTCAAPNHPQQPELGRRALPFTRELWIERDDFAETPPKGYFRLTPGAEVRLRYAYIVRCTGVGKDARRQRHASSIARTTPATRSGTPGADARKVKGNIHWLSAAHAVPAEVRLYDRLFRVPFPGARKPGGVARRDVRQRGAARRRMRSSSPATTTRRATNVERNYLDDLNPGIEARDHRVRRAGAGAGRAGGARSSSSGTATSSPTSSITRPGGRCSTAPSRCGIPGRSRNPPDRRVARGDGVRAASAAACALF